MTTLQMQLSRLEACHWVLPFFSYETPFEGAVRGPFLSSLFYYVLFTFSCGSFYEKCTPSSN